MSRLAKLCFIWLSIALAGCATTKTTPVADRALTLDYQLDGVSWQGGGVLGVFFKAFDQDGKVSLCGAYTTDTRRGVGGTTFNDLALQSMSVSIDDKLIARDLSFFRKLPFPEDRRRPKGSASCVVTEIPWQSTYGNSIKPKIDRGRNSFVIRN